jgi:hypothetical protein
MHTKLLALFSALLLVSPATSAASRMVGSLPRADNRPLENLPKVDTELGELATRSKSASTRRTAGA